MIIAALKTCCSNRVLSVEYVVCGDYCEFSAGEVYFLIKLKSNIDSIGAMKIVKEWEDERNN
jgi:hypothetical protein